jgi:hypothetical protein
LSTAAGFDMTLMFMDESEKKDISEIIKKLKADEKVS